MMGWGRSDLAGITGYRTAETICPVKLDANEATEDFPAQLKEEVLRRLAAADFNRYPERAAGELAAALGRFLDVPAGSIVLGNGSDELIQMLALAAGPGRKVIIPTPTFSMYRLGARLAGAVPVEVPLQVDFTLDTAQVIAAAGTEPALIILCSPNNPTGNCFPAAAVEEIIRNTNSLVAVDEAYGDFAGQDFLPLLGRYGNLVILRTFSKAFGLAGIRVGYGVAGEVARTELDRVKPPYNLNLFALLAAQVALENPDYRRERIARIRRERDGLAAALAGLPGVEVFPSATNFILFRLPGRGSRVADEFKADGIAVRSFTDEPRLADCLRVTVGSREENGCFLDGLRRALSGSAVGDSKGA